MTGRAVILQGNALNLPIPTSSVDLICTSPPYFGLRSYQDAGVHYDGQIGSEPTPAEFLDALIAATREMVRVLKPSGSIFVNLGDKYAGSGGGPQGGGVLTGRGVLKGTPRTPNVGIPNKSLMGMPWRYAIACIDQLGLILRAEIIWAKPNGLPESVTDRVRRSHETWFHFVKRPQYYSAIDTIREWTTDNGSRPRSSVGRSVGSGWGDVHHPATASSGLTGEPCSLTELPTNCGWDPSRKACSLTTCVAIASASTLNTSSPSPCAKTCYEAQRPWPQSMQPKHTAPTATNTTKPTPSYSQQTEAECVGCACEQETGPDTGVLGKLPGSVWEIATQPLKVPPELGVDHFAAYPMEWPRRIIQGWTPLRGRVCDPFGGTGTTALVAKTLGRIGITIDLSADYCRLAEWRCNDPRELAAALQVEKPEYVPDDQLMLFETP